MTEKNFEWLRTEKIKEAQKMMEDGLPIEVICKMLGLSPWELQNLRQSGDAHFKWLNWYACIAKLTGVAWGYVS